jgi:hypothetical protein
MSDLSVDDVGVIGKVFDEMNNMTGKDCRTTWSNGGAGCESDVEDESGEMEMKQAAKMKALKQVTKISMLSQDLLGK